MSGTSNTSDDGAQSPDPPQSDPSEETGLYPIPSRHFLILFYPIIALWAAYLLSEAITYTRFADYFFPHLLLSLLIVLLVLKFV
jgi:hypothetical protein